MSGSGYAIGVWFVQSRGVGTGDTGGCAWAPARAASATPAAAVRNARRSSPEDATFFMAAIYTRPAAHETPDAACPGLFPRPPRHGATVYGLARGRSRPARRHPVADRGLDSADGRQHRLPDDGKRARRPAVAARLARRL